MIDDVDITIRILINIHMSSGGPQRPVVRGRVGVRAFLYALGAVVQLAILIDET